ncbi:MAG: hypothetical protein ACE15D_11045 [Candidatus Eisenbacteria bacterium]
MRERPAPVAAVAGLAAWIGLACLIGSGCSGPPADAPAAPLLRASVDPDSAGLGDPVVLTIEAYVPAGTEVALESEGDSLGPWKILRAGKQKRRHAGQLDLWRKEMKVAAYRLGSLGPDSLRLRSPAGGAFAIAAAAPRLEIGGSIPPGEQVDPSKARGIRDLIRRGLPGWVRLFAILVLAAAAIVSAILWWTSRKRRARAALAPAAPRLSPEEEFEAAIARLLGAKLLERGLAREFYYEVSRAVRLYLERLHELPLLESTSEEVRSLLAGRIAAAEDREALRDWLAEGDLVKYARLERLEAEALRYLERSRDLVKRLAPPPPAPLAETPPGANGSHPLPQEARP